MPNLELFALSVLRALTEVAMMTLLGQGIVAFLAGARRATNPIYMLFRVVTRPVLTAVRFVTPRVVVDKHVPFVAFFFLFWLWIVLAYIKRAVCEAQGLNCLV